MADTKNVETIVKGAGSVDASALAGLSAIQSTLDNMSAKLSAIRDLSASQLSQLSTLIEVSKSSDQPSLRDKATAFMDSGPAKPVAAPAKPAAAPAAKGGGGKEEGGMSPVAMMAVAGVAGAAAALAGILSVDAEAIKKKVETLLSIVELPNMTPEAVAGVGLTLGALGAGLLAFGIGQTAGALAQAVTKFAGVDDWAQNIVDNVSTLLSIMDIPGVADENKGLQLGITLGAIGAGLAFFAVGKTAAGVAEGASAAIEKFGGGGFNVDKIVSEVTTLVEMASAWDWGKVAGTAIKFPVVMGALGAGLAFYGAGKAVEGVSGVVQGAAQHVQKFGEGGGFGDRIKKEVTALLSILDNRNATFSGAAGFVGVMGAIGAGLAAYAVGKAAEGGASAVQGAADHISKFSEKPFAERVKQEVTTLLTIPTLPGVNEKNALEFVKVMGLLGGGLVAFSIGKGLEGAAEGAQAAVKSFTDTDIGSRVKKQVVSLLSVLNEESVSVEKSETFVDVMVNISKGLAAFAAGEFVGALGKIGGAISGFLSGDDSTITQILNLAKSTDQLKQVASDLTVVQNALAGFSKIKINVEDLDIEEMVEKLGKAIPNLEVLANGGELNISGGFDKKIKGILHPDLKLDEMIEAINKVNKIIGINAGGGGSSDSPPSVAPGATQQGAATKSQMVDQVGIQAGAVNLSSPVVNITAPPAQGEGGGGGDAGVRTNNVVAPRSGQLGKDVTKNFAYGA